MIVTMLVATIAVEIWRCFDDLSLQWGGVCSSRQEE